MFRLPTNVPVAVEGLPVGFSPEPVSEAPNRVTVDITVGFSSLLQDATVNPIANRVIAERKAFFFFIKFAFNRMFVGLLILVIEFLPPS